MAKLDGPLSNKLFIDSDPRASVALHMERAFEFELKIALEIEREALGGHAAYPRANVM